MIGSRVDRPHIVLWVHAQSDCSVEAVNVLPELAHELSARVELKQPRPATRERAIVAERGVWMARPRVDEDLPFRIRADAGHLADIDVIRHLQQIGVGLERNVRCRGLSDKRSAKGEKCNKSDGVEDA